MSKVSFYSVQLPNRTGEAAKLLCALKEAGVNISAFWGYPVKGKNAQIDLIPDNGATLQRVLKRLGLETAIKRTAFQLEGPDEPGVLGAAFAKLAAAGINVFAAQAMRTMDGKYAALIQVSPDDEAKAKKALS